MMSIDGWLDIADNGHNGEGRFTNLRIHDDLGGVDRGAYCSFLGNMWLVDNITCLFLSLFSGL